MLNECALRFVNIPHSVSLKAYSEGITVLCPIYSWIGSLDGWSSDSPKVQYENGFTTWGNKGGSTYTWMVSSSEQWFILLNTCNVKR